MRDFFELVDAQNLRGKIRGRGYKGGFTDGLY
jgi:hypothetical protein